MLACAAIALLAIGALRDGGALTPEDRVDSISKRLACPVCDGESIYESRNPGSVAIRNVIRDRVAEGTLSDEQIIAEVQASQSADLLLVPRASGFDALVWLVPVGAAVVAAGALTVTFLRWRDEAAHQLAPTDADRRLVAAALDDETALEVRRDADARAVDGPVDAGEAEP